MRITEDTINHNAVRIIDDLTSNCYGMIAENKQNEERDFLLMTMGEIQGVCDLTRALKEVLKK